MPLSVRAALGRTASPYLALQQPGGLVHAWRNLPEAEKQKHHQNAIAKQQAYLSALRSWHAANPQPGTGHATDLFSGNGGAPSAAAGPGRTHAAAAAKQTASQGTNRPPSS